MLETLLISQENVGLVQVSAAKYQSARRLHSAPGSGELGAEPGSGPGRGCRPEQNKNPGHMFTGLQLHHPATGRRQPTGRDPHHPRPRLPSTTFLETVEIVPGPIFNSSPRRDEGRRLPL